MATCEVVYDYVEDIDPNLTCIICQSALVDPVTTTSCKHTFCRDCISTALSHQPQCPIDRSALGKGNLQDTEMLVKLMLDELKVKCGSEGCGKVMERGLLLSHSRSCGKTVVRCTEGNCGLMMKREGLARHRAYECFQRRMECEKCKVVLTFRHQSDHTHNDSETKDKMVCEHCDKSFGPKDMDKRLHKWTCSKAPIPCTHSSRGCTVVCPRESLASHITQCPFEALSSFFEINDNRLSKLEERNASMSRTIDALNTEMGILRADLSSTKESLASVRRMAMDTFISTRESRGILPAVSSTNIDDPVTPRTRTASLPDVFGDTTPRRGASDSLVESSSGQSPTISPPRNGISVSTAADEDEELSNASSISTAFPGRRVGQVIRPNLFMGSRTPLEGPDLARSYADEVFDRLPVGASPEMAISALMSILIRLGTGLDTVDRRARLRAITEILRTQEEIASLRAIVNTLRMQVMIDRPRSFRRPVPIPSLPTQTSETEQATNESSLDPPLPHTPFSSYSLPHWSEGSNANSAGDTGGSDTEGEGGRSRTIPRVRESVLFQQSVNRVSASSTSSLVSTGGRTGRPMGIPPPTPTDFSGIAAMRNHPVPTTNRPRNPIIGLGRRLIQRDRESQPRL